MNTPRKPKIKHPRIAPRLSKLRGVLGKMSSNHNMGVWHLLLRVIVLLTFESTASEYKIEAANPVKSNSLDTAESGKLTPKLSFSGSYDGNGTNTCSEVSERYHIDLGISDVGARFSSGSN